MPQESSIAIKRQARYYTVGNMKDPKEVWFVLHGYGYLAKYFINKFDLLADGERLIVAPEGLHRFYLSNTKGRVGASWMTKENRLQDIEEYTDYLNSLYNKVLPTLPKGVKVNILGFSQGAATASRWVCSRNLTMDNLILWAGVFPPDLNFDVDQRYINSCGVYLVVGDNDEYISESRFSTHLEVLDKAGLTYKTLRFKGKHDVLVEPLKELITAIGTNKR